MLYAYIGVALVIGLLIGFVTLSVIWLSKRVSQDIRSKTVDVISSYDALLEKRRGELTELEERLRELKAEMPEEKADKPEKTEKSDMPASSMLSTAERLGNTSYLTSDISDTYRRIRGAFTAEPKEALKKITGGNCNLREGPAAHLLQELPYETVYKLSILSEEEQKELLETVITGEGRELLDSYCGAHKRFNAIGFYDYLTGVAEMEPKLPKLHVSPMYDGEYPENVDVVVDPDICEGFQIEADNVLYDYCIKGKELS